jgi:phage baseplate assembly protein W
MNVAYPYRIDSRGRTALVDGDEHIAEMIEQLLFTAAGERVMMPELGSGLMQMVFAPNSPEVASALQFTVQAALQQWLGDLIDVRDLTVESTDSLLRVTVVYGVRRTSEVRTRVFERGLV